MEWSVYKRAKTHILQQTEYQNRQHFEVFRHSQLSACASTRGRHTSLIGGKYLDHLIEQRIAAIFQLMRDASLYSFVRQQSGYRNLICRCEYL